MSEMMSLSRKSLKSFSYHLRKFDDSDDTNNEEDDYFDDKSFLGVEHFEKQIFLTDPVLFKHPKYWSNEETLSWITNFSNQSMHSNKLCVEKFLKLQGKDLIMMGEEDFTQRDPFYGKSLYLSFRDLLHQNDYPLNLNYTEPKEGLPALVPTYPLICSPSQTYPEDYRLNDSPVTYTNLQTWSGCVLDLSQCSAKTRYPLEQITPQGQDLSSASRSSPPPPNAAKRSAYSQKNKNENKKPKHDKVRLASFMRKLLDNPEFNPSLLKWIDPESGIFQIVAGKSKEVARLWGEAKHNPHMTFEKLGRSLRWCRKNTPDFGKVPTSDRIPKKLCFKLSN